MKLTKKLNQKRKVIILELRTWAETFNPEFILYDKYSIDEEEEVILYETYRQVLRLIKKYERNQCTLKEYEDINFHVYQINSIEKRIIL